MWCLRGTRNPVDGGPVSDYVTVFPERGNEKFVAEALLSLVDDPNQVQVDSRPRPDAAISSAVGFRVPAEVFTEFQKLMNVSSGHDGEAKSVKRKPGRPRKVEDQ